MKLLFVTGTDTGVGKTTVTRALAAALTARGLRVAALKPIETGCAADAGGTLIPDDGRHLQAATGGWLSLDEVTPERFPAPLSPAAAAAAAGRHIQLGVLARQVAAIAARADVTLVEGAGGLLVPLDERTLTADFVATLGARLVVVARDALGTVNHSLLTLAEAQRRGLAVAGVILSRTQPDAGPDAASNASAIARFGGARMLGVIPHLGPTPDLAALTAAGAALDLDALL
jgi:dethiobiotin synthetase